MSKQGQNGKKSAAIWQPTFYFPSDTALLKALYLAKFEATKTWTATLRNWGQVYGELSIMHEGRLPE